MPSCDAWKLSRKLRRLPAILKERHPEIPWEDIAGAGNIYRHDYRNVLEILIWRTVRDHLDPLQQVVEAKLREAHE
jgi:uncharacterized protein with HEPN domain